MTSTENYGGLQYVPQIAVQYIYLDFDGELTSYNGEILNIDRVEVQDSCLSDERITAIVSELNAKYLDKNVIFVTERPENTEFSTIYIGKTAAFSPYGSFAGVAETIDSGNKNKADNAFVLLDASSSDTAIASTISHEADHLLGTLNHGGEGLAAYGTLFNIGAGVSSTGLTLGPVDFMYVTEGGTVSDIVIDSGHMNVSSGGSANNTTVKYWGNMSVFSGGIATDIIEDGGFVSIEDGAEATFSAHTVSGRSLAETSMTVHQNTIAENTVVNGQGNLYLYSGGIANSTTINAKGNMHISGGVANSTTINSGGNLHISSGGVADITTVKSSGYMSIFSSGTANSTTINDYGSMYIYSGGVANSTTVSGVIHISTGGVANITILDYGDMYIKSGGEANSTTVDRGSMFISTGGEANSTTVNSGGSMFISNGGVANITTVNSSGYISVSSGGVANSTTVNSHGSITVYSGAAATDIVENGGCIDIADGASVTFASNTVSNIVLANGDKMTVHQNTVAINPTVNSGGSLYIYSGGSASDIVWTPCVGYVYAAEDAIVTYVSQYSGVYSGTTNEKSISGATVGNELLYVMSGGVANSTTVSGGSMHIFSGGLASNTTVNYYGSIFVSNGGMVNSTTINSGGALYISSGGVVSGTTVDSQGSIFISNGGVANNTLLSGGNEIYSSAVMYLSSGGTANSTTINSGGNLYISSGGTANIVDVQYCGNLIVSSGGTATDVRWDPCIGNISIADGAYVTFVEQYIGVYLGSDNKLDLVDLKMSNKTVTGSMYVMSDGVADITTVSSGGNMFIWSGGVANGTTVSSGGNLYISNGGVASDTTVNYYGDMHVANGGVANSTTLNESASLYISNGGVASNTTVIWAWVHVSSGGIASSTTVNNGGHLEIYSSGEAYDATIGYGMGVFEGGVANSTTVVSGGTAYINSGGVANSTTVNSYGVIVISSGGMVSNTMVKDNGRVYISNGGVLRGSMFLEAGATVSAYNGGCVDFYLVDRSADDGYLINNLALIQGTPTYTITVSENQAGGTYKLAQGAENFTGTISVGVSVDGAPEVYADIEVNGAYLQLANGVKYSLTQSEGNLTFTVNDGGSVVPPTPDVEAPVMIYAGTTLVSSGPVITEASIDNDMKMLVTFGGRAVTASIHSGGELYTYNGAVIDNLFVANGGRAVFNGATLTGRQVYAGSVELLEAVDAANAQISFVITSRTTESDFIINDLSLLNINTFSVTVSASQDEGIYRLAAGAENFTGTISVAFGGSASFGTISVGESAYSEDTARYYTLVNDGSCLYLAVTSTSGELPDPDPGHRPTITWPDEPVLPELPGEVQPVIIYSGSEFTSDSKIISGVDVNYGSAVLVTSGGSAAKTRVTSGGVMYASSGAVIASLDVASGGKAVITTGTVLRGTLNFAGNVKVSGTVDASAANMHFDISGVSESTGAIVDDIAAMNADKYFITISANQTEGEYILAGNAAEFNKTVTVRSNNISRGTLTVNGAELRYNGLYFRLKEEEGTLALSVSKTGYMPELSATQNGVSFTGLIGDVDCIEFSRNNFASVLQITPSGDAVDLIGLPKGVYQWQVCSGDNAYCGENIESDNSASAQIYTSEANDINDVFFANTLFTWHTGFAAQHQGNANWQGTGESVDLSGKNQIADVFAGSTDANMLVLTDDSCGDALFLDDIFTALGEQARLSQINEIRAGAGNDIIDLTSQQFAYEGSGTTIYGGSGSDTIWANSGNNILFGDAGSDRLIGGSGDDIIIGGSGKDTMHGGGGNDTFCFGGNWGKDTVEQLEGGSVTLHFENGSMDNWNAETLTYTDGNNTVKVSGVTEVTLVFGGTAPVAGAFRDAASENIFEDKSKGMIA